MDDNPHGDAMLVPPHTRDRPLTSCSRGCYIMVPRTRGDRPIAVSHVVVVEAVPPHTRG